MRDFIKLLIGASEKAANIARIIKSDEQLFSLLIEEKKVGEKNTRFIQDFKTLADVLIQESLKWEISKQFPEMKNNIFGEESNTFTNSDGESITVQVQSIVEETASLLAKVMGEDSGQGATTLAEEIHRQIDPECGSNSSENMDIPEEECIIDNYADVGIWIDPIDATNEYVKGSQSHPFNTDEVSTGNESEKVWEGGLHCVTVLIGAFHLNSGDPIVGVVNQPFHIHGISSSDLSSMHKTSVSSIDSLKRWRGRIVWGTSHPLCWKSSIPMNLQTKSRHSLILSSSEDSVLKGKLEKQFNLIFAPGAGYKLLAVILGLADAYILSKDTTHYWDTCGPHSILKALGGGILNFHQFMALDQAEELTDICYKVDNELAKNTHFANLGGIIAYRNKETLNLLRKCLKM